MNFPVYTTIFTSKDGSQAEITGDEKAIEAIERAFKRAGIHFNESVECWDEGYYQATRPSLSAKGVMP